jgi:hypothetical protein
LVTPRKRAISQDHLCDRLGGWPGMVMAIDLAQFIASRLRGQTGMNETVTPKEFR